MTHTTTDSILYALFCLCRDTRHVDATELGLAAGVSPTCAASALVHLEHQGLVDATRARLTMLGLARASALGASGRGGPRIELRQARPRVAAAALPLAAQAELPPEHERPREQASRREPMNSSLSSRPMLFQQGHA